ncbi:murein L,D-transpeptidase catalytic domain family protein [Pseudomonas sp. C27(2019)]|uniref:murein L,D-transpeptidase catalytic domain family protein n=1 Tax=Pseudomonas sp. C27(2019) TaxID=2604941 RepID=UPI0012491AF1|nr:murein L,D-transpeptidase catalytic domain family protein [Pseudomonas sp. C27(2019)]QEY58385.1 murein L,D-transpeptidase catalytic domain family protein [Pseudomonas sp. C27(2019)]
MLRPFLINSLLATLASFYSLSATASITPQQLSNSLIKAAPSLNNEVLSTALSAMQCALNNGADPAKRLAVIDFSLPSSEKRLWIFDLDSKQLVLHDFVAHGNRSGDNFATSFSNINGSHQSSIGLFRTAESYHGKHGYSLRMDGLEPGINDRARERAIVIHSADYVNPDWIQTQGRIGRSQGCPAVRPEIGRMVVDNLKGGQFMFSWYPDQQWLQTSIYLNCRTKQVASNSSITADGS